MANGLTTNHMQAVLEFPFKQPDWTQKMLIGAGLTLLGFVVPIVPGLFVAGYQAAVARRAIRAGELALPEWADWNTLLLDGLKVHGVILIVVLPVLLAFGLGYGGMFGSIMLTAIMEEAGNPDQAQWLPMLGTFAFMALFALGMLLGMAGGLVAPPALTHMIATGSFAAAFRVREWWPIVRANLGAFVLAYVLNLGVSFVFSLMMQFLYLTIVLCCLVPLLLAAYSMYMGTIGSALFGLVYREGVDKVSAGSLAVSAAPPAPALPEPESRHQDDY